MRLILRGLAFAVVAGLAHDRKPQETGASPSATVPLDVSAYALNASYEANEPAADRRFSGRILRVSGIVRSIEKAAWGSTYVVLANGEVFGVHATLKSTEENNDIALSLMRGQSVAVICSKVQRMATIVMLRNCDISTYSSSTSDERPPIRSEQNTFQELPNDSPTFRPDNESPAPILRVAP